MSDAVFLGTPPRRKVIFFFLAGFEGSTCSDVALSSAVRNRVIDKLLYSS